SRFTQMADNINARVEKDDVVNQLNIDTSGVLIAGEKLILDGDTTVQGTFRVSNANITSVNAGKINVGTLSGHTLSGGRVTGGTITQESGSRGLEMYNGNIDTLRNGVLTSRLNDSG